MLLETGLAIAIALLLKKLAGRSPPAPTPTYPDLPDFQPTVPTSAWAQAPAATRSPAGPTRGLERAQTRAPAAEGEKTLSPPPAGEPSPAQRPVTNDPAVMRAWERQRQDEIERTRAQARAALQKRQDELRRARQSRDAAREDPHDPGRQLERSRGRRLSR